MPRVDSLVRAPDRRSASAQEQLTTGKRVNRASDDPAAAARAERALAAETRTDASQRAVDASQNAMTLTESALGDAGDLLQQVREALVAAGNASYSDAERGGVADQIADLRKQLLAVANRTDGAGTYLFGGQGVGQRRSSTARRRAVPGVPGGQTHAASGDALPLTLDGRAAWMTRAHRQRRVRDHGRHQHRQRLDRRRPASPTRRPYRLDLQHAVQRQRRRRRPTRCCRTVSPTAPTNVASTSGQAIEIDGMSVTVTGAPANGDRSSSRPRRPT